MLPDPRPYFAEIPDPRRETKNKRHKLSDIFMIVFCSVLSGVEDWVNMKTFGQEKEAWFRSFLSLDNGIPSHDTLSDVMGCQKAIAQTIIEGEADYVLALKDNHPHLSDDIRLWLDTKAQQATLPIHETIEKDHGRLEIRRYTLSTDIDWLEQKTEWAGLQAIGRVESIRTIGNKTSTDYRYFLVSLTDLPRFATAVRNHWAIENSQHWVLGVQFNEDANRTRKDYSAENLALVRRMVLNVIRQNGPSKQSVRTHKLRATLSDDYRFELIFGNVPT